MEGVRGVVAVEGRRLLLGLTPTQISMVTELGPAASLEQQLDDRTKPDTTSTGQPSVDNATFQTIFGGILQLSTSQS